MPRVAPAARIRSVVEAISGLKRLQREMDRLCRRDRIYKNQRRALNKAIRQLRNSAHQTKI
jgi:hypothetical protein